MDASVQSPNSRRQTPRKHIRKTRWRTLLAGCVVLVLGLALQVFGFAQSGIVYSAPLAHPNINGALAADTTPTDTPSASPPTLTIAVPSSGQGPVGTRFTITGSNWGTADVLVGAASPGTSCADPNTWAMTFLHVRPQPDQTIIFTFTWPASLTVTGGPYSICATNNTGTTSVSFQLLSPSPPTLTLSPTTTQAGSLVNVTGANFVGSGSVTLTVTNAQGNTRELTTLSPDGSGAFSLQYQPRETDVGDVTLHAFTGANVPQGMQPALRVDAKLHVDAAATPTVATTPTTAVAVTSPPPSGDNSSVLLVVVLAVFVVLVVLAGAGALYAVMRSRKKQADGAAYGSGYYGGSNPGFSRPGNIYSDIYQENGPGGGMGGMGNSGWDAPTQGGYFPQSDFGTSAGGWPETDQPDPNWRPRPMTGQWRAPEEYTNPPQGNYGASGSGQYPPQDPWGNPDNSYGQSGQSYGTGQNYGSSSRGGRGSNYPPQPQRDPDDWSGGRNPESGRYPEPPPDNDW